MNASSQQTQGMINCSQQLGKIPFFTRLLYFTLLASWLLDLFTGIPSAIIASSVPATFGNLFLWTIFTGSFYVDSLFLLSIVVVNLHTFMPKLQERYSSIVTAVRFIVNGAIITTITLGIQAAIGFQKPPVNGVEGVWFNLVFKYCYFNDQRDIKFCLCGWKVKKTLYPLVLFGILTILSFRISIPMLVGMAYAFLQVRFQRLFCLATGKAFYDRISRLITLDSVKCWIQYAQNRQPEDFTDKTLFTNLENYQLSGLGSGDALEKSGASDPFTKKGVRIGDY